MSNFAGSAGMVAFQKKQTLLTSTPLAANGVFTSPWFDSQLTGTEYVTVTAQSNVISAATTGIQLEESEDQINTRNVNNTGSQTATFTAGNIRRRYWRVVYTNGATVQATFSLYVTECDVPFVGLPPGFGTEEGIGINNGAAGGSAVVDGLSSASGSPILTTAGSGGLQYSVGYLFNGSTFDRPRNNWTTTTTDTGTQTASFNGVTQTNYDSLGAYITVILGTVSGTLPTLSVQPQYSPDGGTTWINFGPALANLTATGQTGLIAIFPTNFSQAVGAALTNLAIGTTVSSFVNAPLPRTWRLTYTIGGTTPSFAISSVQVNYQKG
jgi:hypothetical protein